MGSNVLVFAETSNAIHGDRSKPLSQRPVMKDGDWAEFGRRITEVAERTLQEGVRVVYHHHMGTIVEIGGRHRRLHALPRARPCIFCSTPATRPGAAPIRRRSPAATAAASAMCTPRTCAEP